MSTRSTCALVLLCLVQGCERFAFSAMLPLFVLYLHRRHGFPEPSALLLVGVFQALSYFGGLPAGAVTDRKLGPTAALILGGALLTLGYSGLAVDRRPLLWPALALLVVGHSFFRPSMSTLLGRISPPTDAHRERSFLWQYLAVNLGGLLGPLCAVSSRAGDHWTRLFLWAASAMFAGTFALSVGARLLPAEAGHVIPDDERHQAHENSRARWGAVWLLCGLAVVFWLTVQQAGSSLVLFAESHTLRSVAAFGYSIAIGPPQFASLHALLVLVLMLVFVVGLRQLRRTSTAQSLSIRMVWGYVATAAAFALLAAAGLHGADTSRVSPAWLAGCYLLLSIAELLLGPLGMALLTQLAPRQRTAQAVGLWFAAAAVGNVAAGALGLQWGRWPNYRYFALLALVSLVAALVLFIRLSPLERLIKASRRDAQGGRR